MSFNLLSPTLLSTQQSDLMSSTLLSTQQSDLMSPTMLSTQPSDLGEYDLVQTIEASESTNTTRRTTSWGFTKLTKGLDKRNIQLNLKSVTEEKLCDTLRKFYAEVKSVKKKECVNTEGPYWNQSSHTPSFDLGASPHNRNFNIIADGSFTAANQMFTARC